MLIYPELLQFCLVIIGIVRSVLYLISFQRISRCLLMLLLHTAASLLPSIFVSLS